MKCDAALELKRVETSDSVLSSGYHLGYVRAMVHAGIDFAHRLPMGDLGSVMEVLRGSGSGFGIRAYMVEPPNQYDLRFVRIVVRQVGVE